MLYISQQYHIYIVDLLLILCCILPYSSQVWLPRLAVASRSHRATVPPCRRSPRSLPLSARRKGAAQAVDGALAEATTPSIRETVDGEPRRLSDRRR